MRKERSDILCITNRSLCKGDFLTRIEAIARERPAAIVLREKDLPRDAYASLAAEVSAICRSYRIPCVYHSFVETALAQGANAIHLPLWGMRELSPEAKRHFSVIGVSCHSVEEAKEAEELGCTYITAGHIFEPECKKGLPGRGLTFLESVCRAVCVPVYGIGGISPENARLVRDTGAYGICVMSTLMQCEDVGDCMRKYGA